MEAPSPLTAPAGADMLTMAGNPFSGGSGKRFSHLVIIFAGVAALVASLTTVVSVWLQSKNYRKPLLQRYVIRILLMVPIYCAASWTSLVSLKAAFWIEPWLDVYEAFTIYAFFQLLINFIGGERALIILMHGRKPVDHLWPLNHCLPKVDISDPHTFLAIKRGILQYTWIKPLLAIATVAMKATGTYQSGYIGLTSGYLWSGIIYNISITISLYALALFWICMSIDLKPFRPMPKFLCIKGIIFASYWQGFFLSILVWLGAIPDVAGYSPDNLATSIQDALICFEMPIFAVIHWYAFSWKDYADVTISAARMPVRYALRDAFGIVDLIQDAKETLVGTKYDYRYFDAGDSVLAHEESAQRLARIKQGMRYERNGKGKYWIPDPHDATAHTPLLGKLTGEFSVQRSRSTSKGQSEGPYGTVPDDDDDDLSLDDDDEKLYSNARNLEFGDWHYPVITAHHATREDRLYATPDIITASTNRHLLQPSKDNKKRRRAAIREIQKQAHGDHKHKGKQRSSDDSDGSGSSRPSSSSSSSRGRSTIAKLPIIGDVIDAIEHVTHGSNAEDKSDTSQLVDLVVEDHQAEAAERVRARKEGSPGWNRHETRHYVRTYPGAEDEDDVQTEEVRQGFEPDNFDKHGNQLPRMQHTVDSDLAIGKEQEEARAERVKSEAASQYSRREYGKETDAEDSDGEAKDEEMQRKRDSAAAARGKHSQYGDAEDNVWA